MIRVDFDEAQMQLPRLIVAALAGEDVVITRAGDPVVDLVAHERPARRRGGVSDIVRAEGIDSLEVLDDLRGDR